MNINNFCFHILLAQYLSDKVMKFKEILRSGYYAVIIFLNVCIHLHPRQQLKVKKPIPFSLRVMKWQRGVEGGGSVRKNK